MTNLHCEMSRKNEDLHLYHGGNKKPHEVYSAQCMIDSIIQSRDLTPQENVFTRCFSFCFGGARPGFFLLVIYKVCEIFLFYSACPILTNPSA
jgi:hypothetical protein